jgi:hypothetical protein
VPIQDVLAGALNEWRRASAVDGGTVLSSTAVFIQIPDGTQFLTCTGHTLSASGTVIKIAFNPYLYIFKTTDALAAVGNQTDYSKVAQDASTSTVVTLSSLDTAANNDYLYVGSHLPFRGVNVVSSTSNSNASVLTVNYWNGSAWTATTLTDGSASAGATFGQSGNVSWTVPTDWAAETLLVINSPAPGGVLYQGEKLYWTRWQVSAALDSTTTLSSMLAMNRSTTYAEWLAGQAIEQHRTKRPGDLGCLEALVDTGAGKLIVNVATTSGPAGFL